MDAGIWLGRCCGCRVVDVCVDVEVDVVDVVDVIWLIFCRYLWM